MQERKQKKKDFGSDFAPSLQTEPVFERPEAGRWEIAEKPRAGEERPASGKWAEARSSFGLETEGGPGFVDPGSFALARHATPILQAERAPASPIRSASRDLASAAPSSPGPSTAGPSGGGASGGGAPSPGGR